MLVEIPRRQIDPGTWDAFVAASPDGYIFALSFWLDMIEPIWPIEDQSFAIMEHGEIKALLPLHLITTEKRLAASGWGWCGPLFAEGSPDSRNRTVGAVLMNSVRNVAAQYGCERLDTAYSPLTKRSIQSRWGVNPLVHLGFQDTSTHSNVVDLQADEQQLWKGLSENARRKIRKARDQGFTVQQEQWMPLVDEYYAAHQETYARTGATCIDKRYFLGMARETAPRGVSRLMVGRAPDGAAAAFNNNGCFLDTAWYHSGCSFTRFLGSGVNYLVMWASILEARKHGGRWFEVGELFLPLPGGKSGALSMFKSKFGGEPHRYYKGALVFNATGDA